MGDVKMRRENIRYEADANAVLANSLNDQVIQHRRLRAHFLHL